MVKLEKQKLVVALAKRNFVIISKDQYYTFVAKTIKLPVGEKQALFSRIQEVKDDLRVPANMDIAPADFPLQS